MRVKNGETILLGGLLKNEEIKSIKQIPFLSKIPILGEIFKSRSIEKKDTEIVIAITPTIVYDENGRPKVETQTSTKGLRDKLNELRAEREGYAPNSRTDADAKAELDKAKAKAAAAEVDKDKLAASLKEREDILKAREAELKAKNAENDKLRRELKKSTAMMRAVIDSMDEGGRHEQ